MSNKKLSEVDGLVHPELVGIEVVEVRIGRQGLCLDRFFPSVERPMDIAIPAAVPRNAANAAARLSKALRISNDARTS